MALPVGPLVECRAVFHRQVSARVKDPIYLPPGASGLALPFPKGKLSPSFNLIQKASTMPAFCSAGCRSCSPCKAANLRSDAHEGSGCLQAAVAAVFSTVLLAQMLRVPSSFCRLL